MQCGDLLSYCTGNADGSVGPTDVDCGAILSNDCSVKITNGTFMDFVSESEGSFF
jgi:hypothetical protein